MFTDLGWEFVLPYLQRPIRALVQEGREQLPGQDSNLEKQDQNLL